MKRILLYVTLLFSVQLYAQSEESDSKNGIIEIRTKLLDNVLNGDLNQLMSNRDLAFLLENESYYPLICQEKWMTWYITEEYDTICSEIEFANDRWVLVTRYSNNIKGVEKKCPGDIDLINPLIDYAVENQIDLQQSISASEVSDEDKQVLSLVLDWLIVMYRNRNALEWRKMHDELNNRMGDILKRYPDTKYKPFLLKNVYCSPDNVLTGGVE